MNSTEHQPSGSSPIEASSASRPVPFSFYLPAWGKRHVSTFLDYALPTYLSLNNIPSLKESKGKFVVYTTRADQERMQSASIWRTLEREMPVQFKMIDDGKAYSEEELSKYGTVTDCYVDGLNDAYATGAAAVMLLADIVISDGTIAEFRRLVEQGMHVIEIASPRGAAAPVQAGLDAHRKADGTISLDGLDMAKLWLPNMHHLLQMHFVQGRPGERFHPAHLYWRVKDEGIIARLCHAQPAVVVPDRPPATFVSTTDVGLVSSLGFPASKIHLCRDSRITHAIELSTPEHHTDQEAVRGDLVAYNRFFSRNSAHNLDRLHLDITITGVAQLSEEWDKVRKESEAFIVQLEGLRDRERQKPSDSEQKNGGDQEQRGALFRFWDKVRSKFWLWHKPG